MYRSDAQEQTAESLFGNIHSITTEVMLEIQKDLEPYDMVSLVFLLYEIPDTALQNLLVYERISEDIGEGSNMNLLYDWAINSQARPTWKYEFLEALTICRLFNVIKKLGFNVPNVKKHYLPNNVYVNIYINPIKKILYRLCEALTEDEYYKLKRKLHQQLKLQDHQTCELLFLELMCTKFITLGKYDKVKRTYTRTFDIEKLAKIIENFNSIKDYALYLREIENQFNNTENDERQHTSSIHLSTEKVSSAKVDTNVSKQHEDFDEIFTLLDQLHMEDIPIQNLKSDTKKMYKDAYPIKNKQRLGVCCIINQEKFHFSKRNSRQGYATKLENRLGSSMDVLTLEKTMSSLNFVIKKECNLEHDEIFSFIREVIKNHVTTEDSVFVLCILSHGVRGHIYAADSVKVKIEDIQDILDSDEAAHIHGIPKVLILQACQVDDETEAKKIKLVADNPNSTFHLKKSHFLIFWATAPQYEAYRNEEKGSVFIQILCYIMKKAIKEQLFDIFTKVTDAVATLCTMIKKEQLPFCVTTLRKKLYFQMPE